MNHSAPPSTSPRRTRRTPSAPTPALRSHSAETTCGSRAPCTLPSGSGRTTKSLRVPWPLTKGKLTSTRVKVSSLRTCRDAIGQQGRSTLTTRGLPCSSCPNITTRQTSPGNATATSAGGGDGGEGLVAEVGGVVREPDDPGVALEPGVLAAGEPPGAPYGLVARLLLGPLAGE